MSGGDAALARFAAFVASAPAVGILSRNLLFLPGGRGGVDSVEINAGLKCYTAGRGVVIGGAAYLLRGVQIVACDGARRLAVETLLAERAMQDAQVRRRD